jgi:hypothetical protein
MRLFTQFPTKVWRKAAKGARGHREGVGVGILGITACSYGFGFEFRLGDWNGVKLISDVEENEESAFSRMPNLEKVTMKKKYRKTNTEPFMNVSDLKNIFLMQHA